MIKTIKEQKNKVIVNAMKQTRFLEQCAVMSNI